MLSTWCASVSQHQRSNHRLDAGGAWTQWLQWKKIHGEIFSMGWRSAKKARKRHNRLLCANDAQNHFRNLFQHLFVVWIHRSIFISDNNNNRCTWFHIYSSRSLQSICINMKIEDAAPFWNRSTLYVKERVSKKRKFHRHEYRDEIVLFVWLFIFSNFFLIFMQRNSLEMFLNGCALTLTSIFIGANGCEKNVPSQWTIIMDLVGTNDKYLCEFWHYSILWRIRLDITIPQKMEWSEKNICADAWR